MSTITLLAPEARAAYGVFATFPRRQHAADSLIERITPMQAHASARAKDNRAWKAAAKQLDGAIDVVGTAVDTPLLFGRPLRKAAVAIVLDAIVAFEQAHATSLPYDDHGRYSPEPGTEYPFSISDIGRAAARVLGDGWDAESTSWGVGANIEHESDPGGFFVLAVDEDFDLYVSANLRDESRTFLTGATASDGLDALAAQVADIVRGFLTTD